MKALKIISIIIIIIFINVLSMSQTSTHSAVEYNDFIIEQQILVNEKFVVLMNSYNNYVVEEMDTAYANTLNQLTKSINFIEKLKGFEDDYYFKEGAVAFFNTYKSVLESEDKRMIELLKLSDKEYGVEQVNEYKKLSEQANKKIDEAFDKVLIVQKKFTEKYQIEIEKE